MKAPRECERAKDIRTAFCYFIHPSQNFERRGRPKHTHFSPHPFTHSSHAARASGGGAGMSRTAGPLAGPSGGQPSSDVVRGLHLRNHALELELKSSMDIQLEAMVKLETELRGGGRESAGGAAPLGGGSVGASDWSKRAAAMALELKWQLGRGGGRGGGGGGGGGGASSSQQFHSRPSLRVLTTETTPLSSLTTEHEVRARAIRIESEYALQRASAGVDVGLSTTSAQHPQQLGAAPSSSDTAVGLARSLTTSFCSQNQNIFN
jgi:hypothetical protein